MEKLVKLKKVKRKRKHGFLKRATTRGGQHVVLARRSKGRTELSK